MVALAAEAAGVEKPGGRTRGVGMQELEEFALDAPEFEDCLLGNVQRAQADDGLEEQEIGGRRALTMV